MTHKSITYHDDIMVITTGTTMLVVQRSHPLHICVTMDSDPGYEQLQLQVSQGGCVIVVASVENTAVDKEEIDKACKDLQASVQDWITNPITNCY